MLDLRDDLEPVFERHLRGRCVDAFEPTDGQVIGATMSVLGFRHHDELDGRIAGPLARIVLDRALAQGLRTDGPWRLRYSGLPGDLLVELAAVGAAGVGTGATGHGKQG